MERFAKELQQVVPEILGCTFSETLLSGIACGMSVKKAMMRNSNLFPLTPVYLALLQKVS
jgi:hypothetical protein